MGEEKKPTFREKIIAKKKEYVNELRLGGFLKKSFVALLFVLAGAIIVYVVSRNVTAFAEFWSRYPAAFLRAALTLITSLLPISLAEIVIIMLVPSVIVFLFLTMSPKVSDADFYKRSKALISLVIVLFSVYLTTFAPCYFRASLEKNLGIESKEVTVESLVSTAEKLNAELKLLESEILYDAGGASLMPFSYSDLVKKTNEAFLDFSSKHDFLLSYPSVPKPIMLSSFLTYTHISGLYSFFTGEANINTNYPDFVIPYTMAHEMSHQRGIAAEDEANFTAFLVCIESDDAFVRYSGYLSMYDYILDALYLSDYQAYVSVMSECSNAVKGDMRAFSEFFEKYRNSSISSVTDAVNNAMLNLQGQTDGILSYGKVVELAVAYYADK